MKSEEGPAPAAAPAPAPGSSSSGSGESAKDDRPAAERRGAGGKAAPSGNEAPKPDTKPAKAAAKYGEEEDTPAKPSPQERLKETARAPEEHIVIPLTANSVSEGVQAVEGVLLANRDVATRASPWKDAGFAADTGAAGVPADPAARGSTSAVQAAAAERVLEIRVRRGDLVRVLVPLFRELPPKDLSRAFAAGGRVLPMDVLDVLRKDQERQQDQGKGKAAGALDDKARQEGKDGAPQKGPAPTETPTPPDSGGGTPTPTVQGGAPPPQNAEPQPPPKPSAEQLRKLAEAPPESREKTIAPGSASEEVVLEIHLRAEGK